MNEMDKLRKNVFDKLKLFEKANAEACKFIRIEPLESSTKLQHVNIKAMEKAFRERDKTLAEFQKACQDYEKAVKRNA
jgi:hypothetical protein